MLNYRIHKSIELLTISCIHLVIFFTAEKIHTDIIKEMSYLRKYLVDTLED